MPTSVSWYFYISINTPRSSQKSFSSFFFLHSISRGVVKRQVRARAPHYDLALNWNQKWKREKIELITAYIYNFQAADININKLFCDNRSKRFHWRKIWNGIFSVSISSSPNGVGWRRENVRPSAVWRDKNTSRWYSYANYKRRFWSVPEYPPRRGTSIFLFCKKHYFDLQFLSQLDINLEPCPSHSGNINESSKAHKPGSWHLCWGSRLTWTFHLMKL